jgi:flagellar basal-body rod protein FlgB
MAINFNSALGVHPQALMLREKRSELLAANLANADTPGFKARDLDFQSVLKQTLSSNISLENTQDGHMPPREVVLGGTLKYRFPNQASLDGNTVETQMEQAIYAENNVQYQASLRFINSRFGGLMTAIKGQ